MIDATPPQLGRPSACDQADTMNLLELVSPLNAGMASTRSSRVQMADTWTERLIIAMRLGSGTKYVLPLAPSGGLAQWLSRFVSQRSISIILAAACVVVDRLVHWHQMGFLRAGVIDEPCEIATALIIVGAMVRVRNTAPHPAFFWSMLAWVVLIDADHLPSEFGSLALTAGTPRPYTHALWVVALLLVATVPSRYWSAHVKTTAAMTTTRVLAGATWGVSTHFFRDVATAPISLWWPITKAPVEVPYWWYAVALALIIVIPATAGARTQECHACRVLRSRRASTTSEKWPQ